MKQASNIPSLLRKKQTWAERLVWSWLRNRRFSAYKFRRQHRFGDYVLDFFCEEARLGIELDGSMHGLPFQLEEDGERDAWLEARGIKVLRFWNSHLRTEKDAIQAVIWCALQERAPQPVPIHCRPLSTKKSEQA